MRDGVGGVHRQRFRETRFGFLDATEVRERDPEIGEGFGVVRIGIDRRAKRLFRKVEALCLAEALSASQQHLGRGHFIAERVGNWIIDRRLAAVDRILLEVLFGLGAIAGALIRHRQRLPQARRAGP